MSPAVRLVLAVSVVMRKLNADIRAWIDTWNEDPRPFVWTNTAEQILESISRYCKRINQPRHCVLSR